jgi:hypothetical protein
VAVWQFKMWGFPRECFRTENLDVIRVSREQIDAVEFSLTSSQVAALAARFSELLPEKNAWSADFRLWGDEKSDDVQLCAEGNVYEPVQMRLDVRQLSVALVDGLCAIARDFDWLLAIPDGSALLVSKPDTARVLATVKRSPAQSFVQDPMTFLTQTDGSEDQ